MSQALIKRDATVTLTTLDEVVSVSDFFVKSGFFADAKNQAQAVVKILAGQELGLPPMVAMTGIHIVQGKPVLGADILAKKVKSSGKYDYQIVKLDDKICDIEFFQQGKPIGHSTFTLEDARKAGTKNLDKFARNMLFARAISNGVRWYCPDVTTMTVYVDGEIDDTPHAPNAQPAGNVIEVEAESEEDKSELIATLRDVAKTAGYETEKRMAAWLKDNIESLPARGNLAFKSWLESFSAELLQYVIDELVAEVERSIDADVSMHNVPAGADIGDGDDAPEKLIQ